MTGFLAVLRRDLLLARRHGSGGALVLAFFVIAAALFPLGVGPEPGVLARIAGGVVWICGLLAVLLSLDRLFQADHEDGSLEQLALAGPSLWVIVLAKVAAHWLSIGLPLVLLAPLLGLLLQLPLEALPVLTLSMLLGTPSLCLIGGIGAALTVGIRRGGVLLSLLVLPLYVPPLIFGVAAVEAVVTGLGARPHLLLLAAQALAALALAPWATAAALRLALE
ncbi:MAG: heme exporter protein CcmB [Alphaproteobacteria bacterium]|nr:heme exporter protein CcmB [Alphaproteobacteria bacterium]